MAARINNTLYNRKTKTAEFVYSTGLKHDSELLPFCIENKNLWYLNYSKLILITWPVVKVYLFFQIAAGETNSLALDTVASYIIINSFAHLGVGKNVPTGQTIKPTFMVLIDCNSHF